MGLGKLIFGFLLKIRDSFQKGGQKLFSKARDPETGKFKYVSPHTAKKILYVFGGVFFAIVLVSQLITRNGFSNKSFDDYQKEIKSDGGTRMRDPGTRALFDRDPLAGSPALSSADPLEEAFGGQGSTSAVDEPIGGQNRNESATMPAPAASECFAVIEKAKTGAALSITDRSRINSCIANNVVPVSEAEKGILRALAAGDLTPAERQALLSTLKGEGTDQSQALSDVIAASVDPDKQGIIKEGVNKEFMGQGVDIATDEVRGLSKTLADKPRDFEQAIGGTNKILAGETPDSGEKSNLVDAIRALKGGAEAALDNPNLSPDKEKALQSLIDDIQGRDDKLEDLRQQLASAQADAREAAEKLTQGLSLTSEEQAALDRMSSLRKETDALAALQEKRQRSLIELTSRLQKTVAQAELSIQRTIPSGVFEGYADYQPLDCKTIKPLVKIAKKSPTGGSKSAKNGGVNLKSKPAFNIYRIEDEVAKSGVQPDGKRLDISKYMQQNITVAELFIMKGAADRGIVLSPDTKIAAMLDTEILASSTGAGQVVRIRIVQDVYDAKDRRLVIPKNSIAVGRTNTFDDNTGVMDFVIDKVSIGSGEMRSVQLRVGSGDGSMGLRGQIRDTRGRYLLGAFITSFTAGALDFFTQSTITQYRQSAVAATALTGAAYGGGADVMSKIANLYANDLQNSPKIFYSPRGLPIVLYPEP